MRDTVYSCTPIGRIDTPFKQKFGVPRQSGLAQHAIGVIELYREFGADSVRGLEEYDYLWLQFVFHQVLDEGYKQMVRPPRLGGKIKKGVFATRSPHRPNHMGLSLVRLQEIQIDECVRIVCSGVDLVDGTPILDIKPYLAHLESHPYAKGGFGATKRETLVVQWLPESRQGLDATQILLIEEVLAQDPRPAQQHDIDKIFVMNLAEKTIHFRVDKAMVTVLDVADSP